MGNVAAVREGAKPYKVRCFQCPWLDCKAFKDRTVDQIATLDSIKRDHLTLPAGSEIIHPGQENAEIFTLFSGWAYRYRSLPDGRKQILNFLLPGDLIGLQSAMFQASAYGVEALTEVELCLLPRRRVWNLFETRPELAFEVAWLGSREESLVDENLMSVGCRTALERIAALLVGLYKRADALGMVKERGFVFPINQQHIADALGLSLVHTNKTMARLRRMGLFHFSGGVLYLDNPRAVERVAQHYDRDRSPRPLL